MPGVSRMGPKQASAILRELPPGEAFYFYRAIDNPLNVSASSLKEFLERIATVESASLTFHSERKDFEIWVSMLGDEDLVRKLAGMRGSGLRDETLRTKLYRTTRNRVEQLSQVQAESRRRP